MSRVIIFTGKGGVGKTSVAAAHACKSAMEGKKTIIVSTDMTIEWLQKNRNNHRYDKQNEEKHTEEKVKKVNIE